MTWAMRVVAADDPSHIIRESKYRTKWAARRHLDTVRRAKVRELWVHVDFVLVRALNARKRLAP